jgi:hypothetical protein
MGVIPDLLQIADYAGAMFRNGPGELDWAKVGQYADVRIGREGYARPQKQLPSGNQRFAVVRVALGRLRAMGHRGGSYQPFR